MMLGEKFRKSKRVFIGRITAIEDPPSAASGAIARLRGVEYEVIGTLKGPSRGKYARVMHFVVGEARDRQPSNTQDAATPLRVGAIHMVFAVESEDMFNAGQTRLEEFDSDDGLVELSNDLLAGFRRAFGPPRGFFAFFRWLFLRR